MKNINIVIILAILIVVFQNLYTLSLFYAHHYSEGKLILTKKLIKGKKNVYPIKEIQYVFLCALVPGRSARVLGIEINGDRYKLGTGIDEDLFIFFTDVIDQGKPVRVKRTWEKSLKRYYDDYYKYIDPSFPMDKIEFE